LIPVRPSVRYRMAVLLEVIVHGQYHFGAVPSNKRNLVPQLYGTLFR
jgi:hypothetical protein